MIRRIVPLLALVLATAPHAASAQSRCTQETLIVRGTPVNAAYCVTGPIHSDGDEVVVPVSATYTAAGGTANQASDLHFVGGERSSRILQRFELNRIGMAGVLHLTLLYAGGVVRLEGALLTPGGVTIK